MSLALVLVMLESGVHDPVIFWEVGFRPVIGLHVALGPVSSLGLTESLSDPLSIGIRESSDKT